MREPADGLLVEIRELCSSFPEVTERPSHGTPTFFVGNRAFVQTWMDGHHDHGFAHLWCAAAPGVQQARISSAPGLFFRPPYVGHRGWIGMRLDGALDHDELAEVLEDAYRAVAPPRLVALLNGSTGS